MRKSSKKLSTIANLSRQKEILSLKHKNKPTGRFKKLVALICRRGKTHSMTTNKLARLFFSKIGDKNL